MSAATLAAAAEPDLCDDEGCPQHGTGHVCLPPINWERVEAAERGENTAQLMFDCGKAAGREEMRQELATPAAAAEPSERCTECGFRFGYHLADCSALTDLRAAVDALATPAAAAEPVTDASILATLMEWKAVAPGGYSHSEVVRRLREKFAAPAAAPEPLRNSLFPEHVYDRRGKEPCGECHIQPGETCDICGATPAAAAEPAPADAAALSEIEGIKECLEDGSEFLRRSKNKDLDAIADVMDNAAKCLALRTAGKP